jgi:hypothetical protein
MNNFKDQFSLFKVGDNQNDFYNKNFSERTAPSALNENITPADMYPNNQFDLYKNSKYINKLGQRRDNTVVINNYYSNETARTAKPKNEIIKLFEPYKNDTAIVDNNILKMRNDNRYTDSLTIKNNDYPDNTYIRPESIDGVPLTEVVRVREKNQVELRGKGINSIPLASEGRTNETPFKGNGLSAKPESIVLTKYKMKSYYEQSPEDFLKTTGMYLKPDWRSIVQPPSMDRTQFKQVIGAPTAVVSKNEFRNNQTANPTQKEELLENKYISNTRSIADNTMYHNNDSMRPTQKEDLIQETFVLNARSTVDNSMYRNNQTAIPTIREDLSNIEYISNFRSPVDHSSYHNNQSSVPTIREDTSNIEYISNFRSAVDNTSYHNNQTLQPTIREDTSNIEYISNSKSIVDNPSYHNNQSTIPTIREDTSNIDYISNPRSVVDHSPYHNNQSTLPTIREDTSNIDYISNPKSYVDNTSYHNNMTLVPTIREDTSNIGYISNPRSYIDHSPYHNNMALLPTIREDTSNIEYLSNTKSVVDNTSYHNNMTLLPTIREDTSNTNYISNTRRSVDNPSYHNNQTMHPTIREDTSNTNYISNTKRSADNPSYHNNNSALPTQREDTSNTNYISGTKSVAEHTSYHNNNDTRSGFVEEVLAKDYMGAPINNTTRAESRLFLKTYHNNESIQESLDLTNRTLVGGTDQLSAGTADIGTFNSNMKRQSKNIYNMNRMRNVSNSYIEEIPESRGKLLLEQRSEINKNINHTLNGNPFVNNMVHQSYQAPHDIIRENTIISDRL